jgi:phospholipid/cholesterol/gamma-HCH transport system ATP-binding protein
MSCSTCSKFKPGVSDQPTPEPGQTAIQVSHLDLAYGSFVPMRDLTFDVPVAKVMVVMGGSGCGKSTLLKYLIGLKEPHGANKGKISYFGEPFTGADETERVAMLRRFGVLYQGGALWSSMTLAENVALPLEQYTKLGKAEIREVCSLKLALVGLKGYEDFYPSEISGGMRKRAGLARAMALDPDILFFDEPSAGLDPISSRHLDDLILRLRDGLGTTVVVVTHELASIFAIADDSIFLDIETGTLLARGNPHDLVQEGGSPLRVRQFLLREESGSPEPAPPPGDRQLQAAS